MWIMRLDIRAWKIFGTVNSEWKTIQEPSDSLFVAMVEKCVGKQPYRGRKGPFGLDFYVPVHYFEEINVNGVCFFHFLVTETRIITQ